MKQGSLLRLRIRRTDAPIEQSADSRYTAFADDGQQYIIKPARGDENAYMAAEEWVCSSLANDVGIATPPFAILIDDTGAEVFGSRREGGIRNSRVPPMFTLQTAFQAGTLEQPGNVLSKIYAFDLFVCNPDRHMGNYLIKELSHDKHSIMSIDYSRCRLLECPSEIGFQSGNTKYTLNWLTQENLLEKTEILGVIDRISALQDNWMQQRISEMPSSWLDNNQSRVVDAWWRSDNSGRKRRIELIRQGVDNGTLV